MREKQLFIKPEIKIPVDVQYLWEVEYCLNDHKDFIKSIDKLDKISYVDMKQAVNWALQSIVVFRDLVGNLKVEKIASYNA